MNDTGKTTIAELAFELGKVTRRAIDHTEDKATPVELTMIANNLLEAGHERVPSDLLTWRDFPIRFRPRAGDHRTKVSENRQ